MELYSVYSFDTGFFHVILCLWDSFKLLHVALVCSMKFMLLHYILQIICPFYFDGLLFQLLPIVILWSFKKKSCVHTLLSNVTCWVPQEAALREIRLQELYSFLPSRSKFPSRAIPMGEWGRRIRQRSWSWNGPTMLYQIGARSLDLYTSLICQALDVDWPKEGSMILSETSLFSREWGPHLWAVTIPRSHKHS